MVASVLVGWLVAFLAALLLRAFTLLLFGTVTPVTVLSVSAFLLLFSFVGNLRLFRFFSFFCLGRFLRGRLLVGCRLGRIGCRLVGLFTLVGRLVAVFGIGRLRTFGLFLLLPLPFLPPSAPLPLRLRSKRVTLSCSSRSAEGALTSFSLSISFSGALPRLFIPMISKARRALMVVRLAGMDLSLE